MKYSFFTLAVFVLTGIMSAAEPVFQFDFSDAGGKKEVRSGAFRCISEQFPFVVESGALRVAPSACIYIEGKLPDLSRELTLSLWFLRRGSSWDNPLLMRGYHEGNIDFLVHCKWVYPAFFYKDPKNRGRWDGLYVDGPIPRDMHYGDASWRVSKAVAEADRWNCLQVTFKDGEKKIYLNGELNCRNVGQCRTLSNSDDRIWIGSERLSKKAPLGYVCSDMLVNQIRLFARALDETELRKIYDSEKAPFLAAGKIQLASCEAYPPAPGHDPEFKNKLSLTAQYEKNVLPKLDTRILKGQSDAILKADAGSWVFLIGGKEYYPLQVSPAARKGLPKLQANVCDFAASGVELVNLTVPLHEIWTGDGKYDFSLLDERASAILKGNPDARMMAWVLLRPVEWFNKLYRDTEIEKSRQGKALNTNIGGGPLGSDLWEKKVNEYLAAVVRHIESSPYADRVFGYLPGGGESGEWYWPGGVYQMTVGYSKATGESFRAWLRERYKNDVIALRKAWHNPDITFETAAVPPAELREKIRTDDSFADPAETGAVTDFRRYMSDRTYAAIARAAHTIKQNSSGKKLVFLYNGYSLHFPAKKHYNSGLLITERVLNCPDIDVIVTPANYSLRNWGQAGLIVNPWAASQALHGKMGYQEDDLRTQFCLTQDSGRSASAEETVEIIKRSTGYTLTRNIGLWWLLFEPHWFHEEKTMNAIAAAARIGNAALGSERRNVAEVAFLWDEESLYDLNRVDSSLFNGDPVYQDSLRMGAPSDFYLLGDLANPKMPDYKLYIVMNAYRLDAARRAMLEKKLKRNHAVIVWCYAPGYLGENGRSVENIAELTGIRVKELPGHERLFFHPTDRTHPITRNAVNIAPVDAAPVFIVDDPAAKVLGNGGNGRKIFPSLAVREFPQWRSVYSMLPLSKELLLGLCDYAGVHVYSRSYDILSVNSGYLMLHAVTGGDKTVSLPRSAAVRELFSGDRISSGGTSFIDRVEKNHTRVYELK